MSQVKSSTISETGPRPPLDSSGDRDVSLRLQLQEEIDTLALLILEVRRQSDKVQAIADEIGESLLPNMFGKPSKKNRRHDGQ